jgi:hypothetical protein
MSRVDAAVDRVAAVTREATRAALERLEAAGVIERLDDSTLERAAMRAADMAAAELARAAAGTSQLALRIGAVYAVDELCEYLTPPGERPLTAEAVRKRVKQHSLVAFLTDDRHWAFPAWQFDQLAGRLVPNRDIVTLWQRLPHAGFLSDADLAAWMNTRFAGLPENTPAATARHHGADRPQLTNAVARLTQRAA